MFPYLEAFLASNSASSGPVNFSSRGRQTRYYVGNESDAVCWACAGKHESFGCELKRCFRCSEPGHESKDCQNKLQCRGCMLAGHDRPSDCWRAQYVEGLDTRLHRGIVCMICGGKGHVSCRGAQVRDRIRKHSNHSRVGRRR